MVYYRKILTVLLGVSVFFIALTDGILVWQTVSRTRLNFNRELDGKINRITEFTDTRLAMHQLRTSIIASSNALYRYISAEPPIEYNRLVFSNYIKRLYTVTPAQQMLFAVSYLKNDYAITTDGNTDVATMLKLFYMTPEQLEAITRYFEEQFNAVCYILPVQHDAKKYIVYVQCAKNWHAQPVYFFSLYAEDQFFDTEEIGRGQLSFYQDGRLVYTVTGDPRTLDTRSADAEAETEGAGAVEAADTEKPMQNAAVRIMGSNTGLFRYELHYPRTYPFTRFAIAIVLTGIAAAAVIVVLMYRFTRRLYKPIENILRLTDPPVYIEDEFAFISNTIQTLNREVDSMSASLQNYDQLLERTFLRELVCNYMDREEAEQRAARLNLTLVPVPLSAVVICYGSTDASMAAEDEIPYGTYALLKQNLEQIFINEGKRLPFFRIIDVSFDTHVIITSIGKDELTVFLSGILAKQALTEQFSIHAAVGYAVDSLWKIGTSYRNALWLLEIQSYTGMSRIVTTNDDVNQASLKTTVYYPITVEQTLINAVIHEKIELWQSVLTDIFSEHRKRDERNTVQLALLLTATIQRILDGLQKTPEQIFTTNTAGFSLLLCKKQEDLYTAVKAVLIQITEHLRAIPKTANTFLVDQMEQFIKKNYTRNISLDDLAEAVNLSPNYVSTTFKTCFGRNFKDYLNHYRYEAACTLIRAEPAKKIKEVAAACGCSTDILTRLFLKYGKMLPTEFQKQVQMGE